MPPAADASTLTDDCSCKRPAELSYKWRPEAAIDHDAELDVLISGSKPCHLPQMLASTAVEEPEMQLYAASWRVQFTVNLQRCMLAQLRNPCDAAMRLIVSMWVGLIIGAAFRIQPPNPEPL